MNIKLKPRTNGDTSQPKWEADDAMDQLQAIAKLAAEEPPKHNGREVRDFVPEPLPAAQAPKPKPRESVNVRELMETLLEAWTNPSVRMWVDGPDLCFEQVDDESRTKNTWRIGFSHVRTSSVRLIK